MMIIYNCKGVHSATNQTPNQAKEKNSEFKSKVNVAIKAKKNKFYPELKVGDTDKIKKKTKTITEKERTSHFLKGECVIKEISEKVNQTY